MTGAAAGTPARSQHSFMLVSGMPSVDHPVIPKLKARVRFPSPAPDRSPRPAAGGLFVVQTPLGISCQIRARCLIVALLGRSLGRTVSLNCG